MSNTAVAIAVANADALFEAAKRLRAIKNRFETKAASEMQARNAIHLLQVEAHAATSAMLDDDDMSRHRDLGTIQKALAKANTTLDKAVEKGHDEREAAAEAYDTLMAALNDELPSADDIDEDDQQEAA